MHQNCKCSKCKSENQPHSTPSRIPTLQNKCGAFDTLSSRSSVICDCSKNQSENKFAYVSYTKSEGRYPDANKGLENIKTFNIDVDETMRRIEERRQSRGCHCSKKELETKKVTSSVSTKLEGCACAPKDIHFSSTSIPVSLTIKNPEGQSRKSVCSCLKKSSDTLDISSSKQIILPEVKIEICPDKIQTIQIDVKPTDLDTKTSGIITIPVQLRFRRCKEVEVPVEPRVPREKLLFEACTSKEFMENYMEPLIEEPELEPPIQSEEEVEPEEPQETEKISKICHCNEDGTPKKTEIIGLKRPAWQDTMEKEHYIEPYLVEGYCKSTDNVEIQTDLVLGDQLLSDSLNSVPESANRSKPDLIKSSTCICGRENVKASETIRWDLLFRKPPSKKPISFTPVDELLADYVLIKKLFTEPAAEIGPIMIPWTPPPPKTVKKRGISSCSPCCGKVSEEPPWPEPPEPEPLPELVPLPEKITFVYQTNCAQNEPYLNTVSRAYHQGESNFTPVPSKLTVKLPSKPVIPWHRLEIQKKIKIRKVVKLKIEPRKPPIISASAPCMCASRNNSMSSVKRAPSNKSVTSNALVPCPYLAKGKSLPNQFPVKPLGNNQYQTKILMDNSKTYPVSKQCEMKTKFVASGQEGKMSTKVKFKKDTEGPCTSPQNWQIHDISPINSKTVTCKYLNKKSMIESTPELTPRIKKSPALPCPPCQKPAPKYKTDPVVAAFQACEAELKPVREALSTLKQNLKNLNMPELDCIFHNEEEDFSDMSRTQCTCNMQSSQRMPPGSCPCNRNKSGRSKLPESNVSRVQVTKVKLYPCQSPSQARDKSPTTCAANRTAGNKNVSPSYSSNRSKYDRSERNIAPPSRDSYVSVNTSRCPCDKGASGTGFGESKTMMRFSPFVDPSENPSTKNIFKARNQRFYSSSTYNTFYSDPAPPNFPPYPVNQTASRGYDENYNFSTSTNNCRASCNAFNQNSSSSGSVPQNNYSVKTVLNVPAKRNKGIQKTGSMYRTNVRKRKYPAETSRYEDVRTASSKSSTSETGSVYTDSSASGSYIKPCSAMTQPKIAKCASNRKRIKSQLSFNKLTESMGPFVEAIRSILTVNSKERNRENISCDADLTSKRNKKMRVHMRIRSSRGKRK